LLVEGKKKDELKKSLKQRKYQDLRQFYIGTFDIRYMRPRLERIE
jgi:hypothetical protein